MAGKKIGFFVHEKGICESAKIGSGTRIWAIVHVLPDAVIGSDCNICDGVFIENDVILGDRVTVKCGVQLWDGITVEDDVFIGPNATFTNDKYPRSKQYPDKFMRTIVRKGASIGANATVLPGIEIGKGAMVGAGAVVTMSVPAYAVVAGNPARIIRYIESGRSTAKTGKAPAQEKDRNIIRLKNIDDMRGNLSVAEFAKDFPFAPKRFFTIYGVPSEKIRGQHAHKKCSQLLVCVNGSVHAAVDDGKNRRDYVLDSPDKALLIPPMTWGSQYNYSKNAVLLVFASHEYDEKDYVRDYNEWLKLAGKRSK